MYWQNLKLYFINHLTAFLPASRFYRLKNFLYSDYNHIRIHKTARMISSIKIIGNFQLEIGEDTFIGHDVLITGGNTVITIGNFVDIAPRVCIVAGTHEIDMKGDHSAGKGLSKPIFIDDGVWIGANSTILGGVSIGKKSVIAAGSVITEDIPEHTMAAGVPCKPLKKWDNSIKLWQKI